MRRMILLWAVPLLVVVISTATVAMVERQRTPDWQLALDRYLLMQGDAARVVVDVNVPASQPWKFAWTMADPQVSGGWPWNVERLPYPPDTLRCVLVGELTPDADGARQQMLYVAQHSDRLWRVGWVVHAGPRLTAVEVLADAWELVGCDVPVLPA